MIKALGLGCLLLLISAAASGATVYAYKDASGQTVYSDTPPPPTAKHVEQKTYTSNVIESPGLPYEVAEAAKKNPVVMWGVSCGEPCSDGLALLRGRGMPFKQLEPGSTKESLDNFKKLTGSLTVPVLQVGSQIIKGYGEGGWNAALDSAGYPKSVPKVLQGKPLPSAAAAPKAAPVVAAKAGAAAPSPAK